ncbi:hypothetical protein AYI70_g9650 [Smittium culicis]|uniref:Uncharacterized protein n=1 Tax=Smittium culicis TaxID=133412 RepID=A0A1R1XA99_9FUNG|nr:hypothetical protein AYI70_g9650 [Smittium culicis]
MLTDEEKKEEIYGCPKSSKESAASQKSDSDWAATTKIASSAIQAEAQPRGPPEPEGGGDIPTNKEGHRGDGRATTCIGSKETEPASRGKELQDGIPAINL